MPSALGLPGFAGLETRDPIARPGPIPDSRIEAFASPSLVVHAASATTDTSIAAAGASHTCGPNDNTGFCEKYVSSSTETLPIILGVVIPLVGAFVVFIFLHRRHKKKLKKEDEDDAQKALDFGLGETHYVEKPGKKTRGGKNNQNIPEMSTRDAVATVRRGERGLSMDLGTTNPYLLPPGLEQSRESLHSLSRTLNTGDDKYRSTGFIPNDGSHSYPSSLRSPKGDDGSSFTAASTRRFDGTSNQNLLSKAHRMSGSQSRNDSRNQSRNQSAAPIDRKPLAPPKTTQGSDVIRDSNNYLGQFISAGGYSEQKENEKSGKQSSSLSKETTLSDDPPRPLEKTLAKDSNSINHRTNAPAPPLKEDHTPSRNAATLKSEETREPRIPSINFSDSAPLYADFTLPSIDFSDSQSNQLQKSESHNESYDSKKIPNPDDRRETRQPTLPALDLPHLEEHEQYQQAQPAQQTEEDDYYDEYYDYEEELEYDPNRPLGMGERPLPPDDPSENPEQRANRIRSFYKEYFDESNNAPHVPSRQARHDYYDGSENYTYDGYDVNQYYDDQGSYPTSRGPSRQARFTGPEGRHRATVSAGSYNHPQYPRAFSSASGRYGPPGRRGPPKRNMPPPKPLMALPTPHMLKDDSFLTHLPIDFAPPAAFKQQRAGTPDSLRGEMKPYKAQRAHIPLASSFDDLAVMPSPHALRLSSTFTALDFAPPPKIKGGSQYGGSDAGSVRSGRSGMSAAHVHNIRNGAYRVSRIPKELSGTRDELQNELRPKWDLNR